VTASRSVYFDDIEPSPSGVPRAEIVLYGPGTAQGSNATFTQVLVDTGATHTQIPENVATAIGLNPRVTGTPQAISTSGGVVQRWLLSVQLEVQGIMLQSVPVYFGPAGTTVLVGRSSLYAAFQTTGFEAIEWLRRL
jgi:predicted aspartyl protease